MPIYGGHTPTAAGLPEIRALAVDRIDIEAAQTLTFTFEVLSQAAIAALPAALHPPFPTYCSLVVRRHDDGPYGAFTTAELRLHARATNHYVGYCLGAFSDNADACAWLRNAYGLPCQPAETVTLRKRHYGFEARVVAGGRTVLDAV
ncbi:MAG TPA: acetoacetate decarboxylase family protein, partial [Caulobacteraceae bacterium]|nr:acetoacetate decarboxylase family protein [Caulobacteraceae bacterium]